MRNTEMLQQPYMAFRRRAIYLGADGSSTDDSCLEEALGEKAQGIKDGNPAKLRILVADDEQMIANTLTLILNRSGFEACAVYSGEAAVSALSTFQPDVVISDVVMPGMTGIDAAIVVRSQRPSCKILLLSGQAATADLLQDARARGYSFEIIAKPIHPEDLLDKLRTGLVH